METNNITILQEKIDEQEKIIQMLSNQEIVKGMLSAIEDVKNGDFITLTNY